MYLKLAPHFKWVLIGLSRVLLWFRQRRGFAVPFLLAAFHGKLCYFLTSSSLSLGISQLYNIYRKTATFFEKSDSITLSGCPYGQTSPFPHSLLLPTGPDYRCLKIHPHPCLTAVVFVHISHFSFGSSFPALSHPGHYIPWNDNSRLLS